MTILIKGKVNEAKRKIIHKLGGYTQEDLFHALTAEDRFPYRPKTYTVEELHESVRISLAEFEKIQFVERDICHRISECLMEYAEFSVSGPVIPDLPYYDMSGTIKILRTEDGGKVNLENYHGPALRKETDDEEVDRGGDPQP